MWPGKEFAQGMEAQGTGPKGMEAQGTGPKGMEAQGSTGPKGMEAQGTEPRGMEGGAKISQRNGKGRPGFFSGIGGRPRFP